MPKKSILLFPGVAQQPSNDNDNDSNNNHNSKHPQKPLGDRSPSRCRLRPASDRRLLGCADDFMGLGSSRICYFGCLKGVSKSVPVLFNCIEAVMVLT